MAGLDTNTISLIISALMLFVSVGISSLALKFISKKLNFKIKEYKSALLAAIVAGILSEILGRYIYLLSSDFLIYQAYSISILFCAINLLVGIALIKFIYKETWKNSAKAGILWWVINLIVAIIIGVLIALPALYAMGVF